MQSSSVQLCMPCMLHISHAAVAFSVYVHGHPCLYVTHVTLLIQQHSPCNTSCRMHGRADSLYRNTVGACNLSKRGCTQQRQTCSKLTGMQMWRWVATDRSGLLGLSHSACRAKSQGDASPAGGKAVLMGLWGLQELGPYRVYECKNLSESCACKLHLELCSGHVFTANSA